MSGLAKTFVILILLLSVFFFGTTATLYKTRAQWRAQHESYVASSGETLSTLDGKLKQTRKALDEKDIDLVELKANGDQLGSDLKQRMSDLSSLQRKLAGLEASLGQATALSGQLGKTVESGNLRAEGLQKSLDQANSRLDESLQNLDLANKERDTMKLSLVRAQQQLHDSRVEYQALSEESEMLAQRLEAMKNGSTDLGGFDPSVDALVSAVDAGENLAVISAGREQLVQVGHKFTVSRGDSFIGQLEVIKVYPDLAGARIVYTADGEDVQRGDKVFTSNR